MPQPVNISDVVTLAGGSAPQGQGSVASKLIRSGFNVSSLRTNDVLRKDEWIQFDQVLVEVARQRLVGVADLINNGLRFDVANALGTTIIEWEQLSDMAAAEINMSGVTEGEGDRVLYALQSVPLPIIHKDFKINIRALEASRKMGETLDTTQAALAGRLVAEATESMLFNGATVNVGGAQIYGYKTAPNANTGGFTATDWLGGTQNGENIVTDIIGFIDTLIADNMYGPYMLYVPWSYYNAMADDYKANSDRTILERARAIAGIIDIRPTSNLLGAGAAGDQVILVQMTPDVVDMVIGQQPTTVQWDTQGGMVINFKIMSLMVPRMKSDFTTQSGIFIGSAT